MNWFGACLFARIFHIAWMRIGTHYRTFQVVSAVLNLERPVGRSVDAKRRSIEVKNL